MQIKSHGVDKYRRLVEQNVDQAHYVADLIKAAPELELVIPVSLNVVCFRYVADGLSEDALAELNTKIARQLFFNGVAIAAGTVVNGKTAIRLCIVNHRSKREDFDLYINEFIRIGNELSKSYRP